MAHARLFKSISLHLCKSTYPRSLRRISISLLKLQCNYMVKRALGTMATVMQQANRLRRTIYEGKGPSLGVWQMIPGSNVSRTMARCGFDWILVDCEHGNIDGKDTSWKSHLPFMRSYEVYSNQRMYATTSVILNRCCFCSSRFFLAD